MDALGLHVFARFPFFFQACPRGPSDHCQQSAHTFHAASSTHALFRAFCVLLGKLHKYYIIYVRTTDFRVFAKGKVTVSESKRCFRFFVLCFFLKDGGTAVAMFVPLTFCWNQRRHGVVVTSEAFKRTEKDSFYRVQFMSHRVTLRGRRHAKPPYKHIPKHILGQYNTILLACLPLWIPLFCRILFKSQPSFSRVFSALSCCTSYSYPFRILLACRRSLQTFSPRSEPLQRDQGGWTR